MLEEKEKAGQLEKATKVVALDPAPPFDDVFRRLDNTQR